MVTYKNNAGAVIQLQKLPGGSLVGIDSEDAYTEQILINGEIAQYFILLLFRLRPPGSGMRSVPTAHSHRSSNSDPANLGWFL